MNIYNSNKLGVYSDCIIEPNLIGEVTHYKIENYLLFLTNRGARRALTQFRVSAHRFLSPLRKGTASIARATKLVTNIIFCLTVRS